MGENTPSGRATIADRLNWLIENVHPQGRGPYRYDEIARLSREYAAQHGGPTVSHQTVLNIRNGHVTNPGVDSLRALANVYAVPVTYFLESGPEEQHRPQVATDPSTPNASAPAPTSAPLSDRLNHLFANVRPQGRGPYSTKEVADAVTAKAEAAGDTSGGISERYLGQLRSGVQDNPTGKQLQTVADFFGVPTAYFFDDAVASRVHDDLELLGSLKGLGAREVALRAVASLDDDALRALVPMIEHLGRTGARQRMEPPRSSSRSPGRTPLQ
jgi:transcriptional regulator with XRE-family HTH domain